MFRTLMLLAIVLHGVTLAQAVEDADHYKSSGWAETDFSRKTIDLSEILSGGPPKDGIPSIDAPQFVPLSEARLAGREPVIAFGPDEDRRAYPLQVLIWHEIANDVVGGKPVAVTYCPLCNAAIVFAAEVDGRALTFGTTGLLRNSNLVMYDRQTQSWWQQFTGDAIVGTMTGKTLKILPSLLQSFAEFSAESPNGVVLVPNDASARNYGRNPYAGYDSTSAPFLYRGPLPEGIPAMARVVVVRDGQSISAVSLELLRKAGSLSLGGVELLWAAGQASALDSDLISEGADVGTVSVRRGGADVPYDVTFAFVVKAFHPDVTIRTE